MWIPRVVWEAQTERERQLMAMVNRLTGGGNGLPVTVNTVVPATELMVPEARGADLPTVSRLGQFQAMLDDAIRRDLPPEVLESVDARADRGTDDWFELAHEAQNRVKAGAKPQDVAKAVLEGEPVTV